MDLGRTKYKLFKVKKKLNKTLDKTVNTATGGVLQNKKVKGIKRAVVGDPVLLKRLEKKIQDGTATTEDKLNYRTQKKALAETKLQGLSTVASKAALLTAPVTGGASAIVSGAISGAATAKLAHNVAVRGNAKSNKKLAEKSPDELNRLQKARLEKAEKLAKKVSSPEYIAREKARLAKKRMNYLKYAKYAREEKRLREEREKREREQREKDQNGFTSQQFDLIRDVTNKAKLKKPSSSQSKAIQFIKNKTR